MWTMIYFVFHNCEEGHISLLQLRQKGTKRYIMVFFLTNVIVLSKLVCSVYPSYGFWTGNFCASEIFLFFSAHSLSWVSYWITIWLQADCQATWQHEYHLVGGMVYLLCRKNNYNCCHLSVILYIHVHLSVIVNYVYTSSLTVRCLKVFFGLFFSSDGYLFRLIRAVSQEKLLGRKRSYQINLNKHDWNHGICLQYFLCIFFTTWWT